MKSTSEKLVIQKAATFEKVFADYYPVVCAVANRFLRSPGDSEDVAQEVFVRLWKKRHELEGIASVKAYLFMMVRNLCLNMIRDNPSHFAAGRSLPAELPEEKMESVIIEEETIHLLYTAIDRLPPRSREVVSMSVKGYKNIQIADALGISVNSVKTLKYNAIKILRKEMPQAGDDAGKFMLLIVLLKENSCKDRL
ncbi:RNA polymerase sigma-70 factor [Alistipes sp. OttesenSCG-928-B03]|nr:RNA polymerase sigma-70 factor [Alistipes sp. OttesenSCG-928-B03]